MAIRQIVQRPGMSRLGTVGRSETTAAHKRDVIEKLIVYGTDGRDVGVRIDMKGRKNPLVLNLGSSAAVELVKGILLNLADVATHADDELLAIIKGVVGRSQADAEAVVVAVTRRNDPVEKPEEPKRSRSWKVAVKAKGESGWAYNMMRYRSKESAEKAGADLYSRWMGMESYEIQPSDDEPNHD